MRKKITPATLRTIPALLNRGMSAAEIATAVGCTEGTLRVKCSQMRISLRRRKHCEPTTKQEVRRVALCQGAARASGPLRSVQRLTLEIPRGIMNRLQDRAASKGISDSQFASMLLEVIARDDLFTAVLDGSEDAATLAQPGKLLD